MSPSFPQTGGLGMTMLAMLYWGVIGSCIGSFLNVVVYRLPRGASLLSPRSYCPSCHNTLSWRWLIPVGSYLLLGGRCATCQARISVRYPLMEAGMALLFATSFYCWGFTASFAQYIILGSFLAAAATIDFEHGIIPNRLVLWGSAFGVLLLVVAFPAQVLTHMLAALAAGAVVLSLRWGSQLITGRPGMGMGDAKLMVLVGLFLGWTALWVFFLAIMAGGILGMAGIATGRLSRTARIPFAPFIALATALHFVLPPDLFLPG